jgi:hypothetical protein
MTHCDLSLDAPPPVFPAHNYEQCEPKVLALQQELERRMPKKAFVVMGARPEQHTREHLMPISSIHTYNFTNHPHSWIVWGMATEEQVEKPMCC